MDRYRVLVHYSEERREYIARAVEVDHCQGVGATRAEAIEQLETELSALVDNIQASGEHPPPALDPEQFDGSISVRVTPELHCDIAAHARAARVSLESWLIEVLSRAVGSAGVRASADAQGGGRDDRRGRRRGAPSHRYHDIMENRADFIEYVRNLDGGGSDTRGGRNRGRGRR